MPVPVNGVEGFLSLAITPFTSRNSRERQQGKNPAC